MAQSIERVRAIIVKGDTIALVERIRNGKRYLVFPGGGVEAGESFREAVVREVREETGLLIDVHELVATVSFPITSRGSSERRSWAGRSGPAMVPSTPIRRGPDEDHTGPSGARCRA